MTAVAALVGGAALAAHHPLWPGAALLVFGLWTLCVVWHPSIWLFVVPAGLPLLNFAPWTGWLMFDELDLLLLGVAAAGHARLAWMRPSPPEGRTRWPRFVAIAALVFGAASVIALWRGFADAGGFSFGWFQSYVEPMNSLRVFKPLLSVLLIAAPLRDRIDASRERAMHRLGLGLWTGLALVGLAVLWERIAHPGLLNFSLPYRTVGTFWEMHVGGAAIDAYLALAAPFAAWAVWSARTPARWTVAALVALLVGYACLTTFSRGVYLAVGAPLLLLGVLLAGRRPADASTASFARSALAAGASIALATGLVVVAYAVAGYAGAAVVVLAGAGLLVVAARRWPGDFAWRSAAGRALAAALVVEALAVIWTGSFLIERMAQSDRDLNSRVAHWASGLKLLIDPAERTFGIGLGRLPANYARFVQGAEFSGAVQWHDASFGKRGSTVAGPLSRRRLAGQFALTQQVPLLHGADGYRVELDYRVWMPTPVYFGVCELHLLYDRRCQGAWADLRPGDASWQHLSATLHGPELDAGHWFAPRMGYFTISVLAADRTVDIAQIGLRTSGERELLHNGDFSRQLARWFPVAQGYFVPWHIDNLFLELLIERGPAGLLAFVALMGWTLRRLVSAPCREAALAPFLAASLSGVLLVGLVSSVLDAPRPAFLMLLLLAVAVLLCAPTSRAASPSTPPPCR